MFTTFKVINKKEKINTIHIFFMLCDMATFIFCFFRHLPSIYLFINKRKYVKFLNNDFDRETGLISFTKHMLCVYFNQFLLQN